MKILPKLAKIISILSVAYLLMATLIFFAIRFGWTNTMGAVDKKNSLFNEEDLNINKNFVTDENKDVLERISKENHRRSVIYCQINALKEVAPANAKEIFSTYEKNQSDVLAAKMIFAVRLRLYADSQTIEKISQCENIAIDNSMEESLKNYFFSIDGQTIFPWMRDKEWQTIKSAAVKDKVAIEKASKVANLEPRLLVSSMIVEQVRLFHSEREIFKKFFEPLKILGNANKISLGVMGIKEATAEQIENHLKDSNSPYYLGEKYEHLLDYSDSEKNNIGVERYKRLTSEDNNHYYSYLYGALYLKQMLTQWEAAGFPIKFRAEIVGTLFNIGFPQSKPNANPKVGGSKINVGNDKYSFGSLAYEFYYSGEMQEDFPYITE